MSLIPNKREFLACRMRDLGLLRLIERRARKPSLIVLTYHRIGDPSAQPYYAPISSASAEAFEIQMRTLKETHRVLSLDEFQTIADLDFRVEEPSVLVTFDDGYRDNFTVALPILQSLGMPATFFLTTSFLQTPRLPWWDHLAYVINRSPLPELRLDRPEPMTLPLGSDRLRNEAIARVVRVWLDQNIDENPVYRAHLEKRTEISTETIGTDLFMTWNQAREALAAGLSIGSHTQTHRNLAALTEEEQRTELTGSRSLLEAELNHPISALAYPYGWPGAFNETTRRLAQESGYRLVFSSIEGVNHPQTTDPLAIARLGIGHADSPVLLRARMALYASVGRTVV